MALSKRSENNNQSFYQQVKGLFLNLWHKWQQVDYLALWQEMKEKLKDLPQTNYNLGIYHLQKGNINDAIFRFHLVRKVRKGYLECSYYLGLSYYFKHQYQKAEYYFAEYLSSGHNEFAQEMRFCMGVIENRLADINRVPASIIGYQAEQITHLLYSKLEEHADGTTVQQQLMRMAKSALKKFGNLQHNDVLDIRCGTGAFGLLCRQDHIANIMIGLDVAEGMLQIAASRQYQEQNCYTSLLKQDLDLFLANARDERFDVIFFADGMGYSKDIGKTIDKLAAILNLGGILAIVVPCTSAPDADHETVPQEPYLFDLAQQRFVFAPAHLELVMKQLKLEVIFTEHTTLMDKTHAICYILHHNN